MLFLVLIRSTGRGRLQSSEPIVAKRSASLVPRSMQVRCAESGIPQAPPIRLSTIRATARSPAARLLAIWCYRRCRTPVAIALEVLA
jgi:hypothetical protein